MFFIVFSCGFRVRLPLGFFLEVFLTVYYFAKLVIRTITKKPLCHALTSTIANSLEKYLHWNLVRSISPRSKRAASWRDVSNLGVEYGMGLWIQKGGVSSQMAGSAELHRDERAEGKG